MCAAVLEPLSRGVVNIKRSGRVDLQGSTLQEVRVFDGRRGPRTQVVSARRPVDSGAVRTLDSAPWEVHEFDATCDKSC